VVVVFAPLASYFLMQAFRAFNSARSWRWAALSGIAGVFLAVSSPLVFFVLTSLAIPLGLSTPRRLVYAIVALVPGYVFLAPWLFASWPKLDLIATTSSSRLDLFDFSLQALAVVGLTVLLASLAGFPLRSLVVAVLFSTLIVLQAVAGVRLAETAGLAVLASVVLLSAPLSKMRGGAGKSLVAFGLVGLLSGSTFLFAFQAGRPRAAEDLTAPALVVAQADVDPATRTLVLSFDEGVVADLVWGDGRSVDETSVAYQALRPQSELTVPVATLTAQLVAGNSDGVRDLVQLLGVDFVLVQGSEPQAIATRASVTGMPYFQVSGESRLGALYRVNFETEAAEFESSDNRDIPFVVLAAYLLLALPTPATVRGRRKKRSA
jgi:hypothetical protein